MAKELEGGCFCGEIRYRLVGDPVLQLHCYCKDCLSFGGTDGYAGYMVKNEDFKLLKGAPSSFEKTSKENRKVIRYFCGKCGSNLWGETELGLTSVAAGSLDEPNNFRPSKAVFKEDAPHWARIPKALEEFG